MRRKGTETRNTQMDAGRDPFYTTELPTSSLIVDEYLSANGLPDKTGIKPVDTLVERTISFEKKHLSNPLVQFTLLGLAAYGAYKLFVK
jgi:hypothetical protein